MVIPPGAGCQGSPPADGSGCGTPASTADNARPAWSTRGRRSRQSRPVASDWFSASTAATSSWSRLRTCPDRVLLRSSGARSASSSQRRTRSLRAARSGGHDRARCPAVSAVSTAGSWVLVVTRMSASSAAAFLFHADFLRDRKISQPAASATTRRMSSVQPTAPNPWDSAAAGVPAADVAGGAVGELGRSAEVGVGFAVLVRVGRVGAVAATLGSGGCRSVRSWGGSPSRPRRRRATAEPKDQDQDEPGQKPCPTCPTAKDRCSRPPVPVSGRGWDSPRQHPQDIRIDDHLRIGQGRRGNHARQATPAVLWPGSVCGITRSG